MCNGSVFEKDDTDEDKEEEDKKDDTKADQPWPAPPLPPLLLTHFHLRVGWAPPASPALLCFVVHVCSIMSHEISSFSLL